jgi:hypothetical protein
MKSGWPIAYRGAVVDSSLGKRVLRMSLKRVGWLLAALLIVAIPMKADDWDQDHHHHHRKPPVPAPEPASLALFGTGALCLARMIYKKKNA